MVDFAVTISTHSSEDRGNPNKEEVKLCHQDTKLNLFFKPHRKLDNCLWAVVLYWFHFVLVIFLWSNRLRRRQIQSGLKSILNGQKNLASSPSWFGLPFWLWLPCWLDWSRTFSLCKTDRNLKRRKSAEWFVWLCWKKAAHQQWKRRKWLHETQSLPRSCLYC